MNKTSTTWVLGVVAAFALATGTYFGLRQGTPADATTLLALSLPDAAGKEQSIGQWRGKVVVVNFWATWCEPCKKEMPLMDRAAAEHPCRAGFVHKVAKDLARV